MFKYLKFSLAPLTLAISIYFASLAGNYIWYFFLAFTTLIILGDILLGSDTKVEEYKYPFILNLMLYLNLPLLILLIAVSIYTIDNQSITIFSFVGYCVTVGFMLGSFGVNVGHELTHRKNKKLDMFIGNWVQALCLDNVFAIEHVYGHHKDVALLKDGASARRGEGIYSFMFRSTFSEYKNAFQIEKNRLKIKRKSIFSFENKFFAALFRSIIICIFIYSLASTQALIFYLISALISKILLETINYIEHYGLVRLEGKPVRPRHSWNSNTFVSSAFTFNLTRHSAHHEKAHLPYWKLSPYSDAPKMPYGYMSTLSFALLLPWLYRKIMAKKLLDWDENYASGPEKELISKLSL
jgi:fatty acid desaturase